MNFLKRMSARTKLLLGVVGSSSLAVADTILPADMAAKFTDGTTDIKTVIGLIFGVLVVILVYRMVKRVF